MNENPYAAPGTAISAKSDTEEVIRLYSPTQVACGTIGGPVGLIYFLRANFVALGADHLAKKTLLYGVLLILGLIVLIPLLPEKFPSTPFTVAYIVIARYVAQTYQMTKEAIADSPRYDFQSNWHVLGLGLICLLGSAIVLVGPLMLLSALGVWRP